MTLLTARCMLLPTSHRARPRRRSWFAAFWRRRA